MFIIPEDLFSISTPVSTIIYNMGMLNADTLNKGFEYKGGFPTPEIILNKIPILYCNPETKEFWHQYVDKPLTSEDEIIELKAKNTSLEEQLMSTNAAIDFIIQNYQPVS